MAIKASAPGLPHWRILLGVLAASSLVAAWAVPRSTEALWIAESNGVLNLAPESGDVRFELPHVLGVAAVAVNDVNGELWAYGKKAFHRYSRDGQLLGEVDLSPSLHGGDPTELVVDGNAGNVWLVIQRELDRFDHDGRLRQTLMLPENAVAASVDRLHSKLWIALKRQIRVYDAEGALERTIEPEGGEIADLAYDRNLGQFWVNSSDRLRRTDSAGKVVFEVAGAFGGSLAPDGAGGAWLARGARLLHLDQDGVVNVTTEPFAPGLDSAIVDLAANPQDASVWLASVRRLRHYAVDGELLQELTPDLGDGAIRRLFRAALYADLDPPEVRITAPAEGAILRDNSPTLRLEYFDLAVGVDPDSIRVTVNGQAVAASCTAGAHAAQCALAGALPEGRVLLSATVADFAGNVSEPAEVHLTIDTIPPEIVIAQPAPGYVTNQAVLTIMGSLSEAAALSLDGATLALDDDLRFTASVTLREGVNAFQFAAMDLAGNSASRDLAVTLDTVPPPVPQAGLIEIGKPQGGKVVVTGAAGSVEPGSRVRITNLRTGVTVTVVAYADGSFLAEVEAEAGDEITVVAADAASNASDALALKVPAALSVTILEPADGASLQHEPVLVIGSFTGPLNTAITVNGKAATVVPEGDVLKYYVTLTLQPGANVLTAVATSASATVRSRSITVNRTSAPFTVALTYPPSRRLDGPAPFGVGFVLKGSFGFYDEVSFDANGDGRPEQTVKPSLTAANVGYGFVAPGLYRPRFWVLSYNNTTRRYERIYETTFTVVAFDAAQLALHADRVLRSVWTGLNGALLAGDIPAALSALSFDSRGIYEDTFRGLQPHMADVLDDFTDIEQTAIAENYAEYAIMNVRDGKSRVHIIGFVRGADGVWRIDAL